MKNIKIFLTIFIFSSNLIFSDNSSIISKSDSSVESATKTVEEAYQYFVSIVNSKDKIALSDLQKFIAPKISWQINQDVFIFDYDSLIKSIEYFRNMVFNFKVIIVSPVITYKSNDSFEAIIKYQTEKLYNKILGREYSIATIILNKEGKITHIHEVCYNIS